MEDGCEVAEKSINRVDELVGSFSFDCATVAYVSSMVSCTPCRLWAFLTWQDVQMYTAVSGCGGLVVGRNVEDVESRVGIVVITHGPETLSIAVTGRAANG